MIKMNLSTFNPLGEMGLFPWLTTYGIHNLGHTLWFFALLDLLALLAINTFVCSTDRLIKDLKRARRTSGILGFLLRQGPQIMHYAVILVLLGYLGSYALSESLPGKALSPGGPGSRLPRGQGEVSLKAQREGEKIYRGGRLGFFEDYYLDPGYVLQFTGNDGNSLSERISYNHPAKFMGYRFYLMDFHPKKESGGSMGLNYIKFSIRHDPSAAVYLIGMLLFLMGLVLYLLDTILKKVPLFRGPPMPLPEEGKPLFPQAPKDIP
jgi:hypothetical protein